MEMNRREMIVLTAAICAGCKGGGAGRSSDAPVTRTIDAGPFSQYAGDGIYDSFHDHGFFIVNEGGKLFAISSICTHRDCKLHALTNRTLFCKCHGSRFTEQG